MLVVVDVEVLVGGGAPVVVVALVAARADGRRSDPGCREPPP